MLEQGHGIHDSALILETIKLRDEHVHVACKVHPGQRPTAHMTPFGWSTIEATSLQDHHRVDC